MYQDRDVPPLAHDPQPNPPYLVHVGDTNDTASTRWATFLRSARAAKGLSQEDLADQLGVERKKIWRWETGNTTRVDAVDVIRVARVLDLTPLAVLTAIDPEADSVRPPAPLPPALARLVAMYAEMNDVDRSDLLDWIDRVNDWAEMRLTQGDASRPRTRPRRTG